MNPIQMQLLHEIVSRRNSKLTDAISGKNIKNLTNDEKNELVRELAAELIEHGLNEYDEPNQHGFKIENLIDYIKSINK